MTYQTVKVVYRSGVWLDTKLASASAISSALATVQINRYDFPAFSGAAHLTRFKV
jgi:hypothetical protein